MSEESLKMMLNTLPNKEKVQQAVTNNLRTLGVKPRLKRNVTKPDKEIREKLIKIFNVPLSHQSTDAVKLSTGALVHVPTFVRQAVQFLDNHINQEGLFRKGGSNSRLKELVARLDNGNHLGDKNQAIDVANCLKKYFRDLPEPLIPYGYHDLFVRCGMLKIGKIDAILQACLLLPPRHLSTLAFFMDFLRKVSLHEQSNKMGTDNLAKVIGPNVMPLRETTMAAVQTRLEAHLTIVKILIENCRRIGVVPKSILESTSFDSNGSTENELDRSNSSFKQKKKKHRSGSLTRMFNGLRKIVGKNGSPEIIQSNRRSLDSFSQMSPIKSTKKRKNAEPVAQQHIIPKKKRDSIDCNSNNPSASRVLFASPISNDPNPTQQRAQPHKEKTKKLGLNLERFVSKSRQKMDIDEQDKPSSPVIERRWSMASGSSSKYLKKRNILKKCSASSLIDAKFSSSQKKNEFFTKNSNEDYTKMFTDSEVNLSDENFDQRISELSITPRIRLQRQSSQLQSVNEIPEIMKNVKESEEYVRVSKSEYEEIKNRVSAIESRICEEFENIDKNYCMDSASEVQSKYERTLDEASLESTTPTDQLAKRLNRELKIRRSMEPKVIRSPSARKIGVIRRRSQEKPIPNRRKINRAASWHISDKSQPLEAKNSTLISQNDGNSFCSDATNARLDYLHKQLCTLISHTSEHTRASINYTEISRKGNSFDSPRNSIISNNVRRASSFHGSETLDNKTILFNNRMQNIRMTNNQRKSLPGNNEQIHSNTKIEIMRKQDEFTWKNASIFLESEKHTESPSLNNKNQSPSLSQTGRASIAKLRTQNAGMVLAKAKLFDENESHKGPPEVFDRQRKINSQLNLKEPKISISPTTNSFGVSRRKKSKSPKNTDGKLKTVNNIHRQISTKDQENSRKENDLLPSMNEYGLYRNIDSASFNKTPHIKKQLAIKTPKSARSLVRRAPVDTRRTPLKAVPPITTGTPKRQSPRNVFKSRQISRNIN